MKHYLLVLLIISGIVFATQTNAQEAALTVSPAVFEFDVLGGEKFYKLIEVKNNSDVPLPIFVSINSFDALDEYGGIKFIKDDKDDLTKVSNWLEPQETNFILPARSVKKIKVRISIPSNSEIGSHYAAMILETRLPSYYYDDQATKILPSVGVLFEFNIQNVNSSGNISEKLIEIIEFKVDDFIKKSFIADFCSFFVNFIAKDSTEAKVFSIYNKLPDKFLLKLKNNNVYHIRPNGHIKIYNLHGKLVNKTAITTATVMPNRIRSINIELNNNIVKNYKKIGFFGRYRVVFEYYLVDNAYIAKEIYLWVFPWKIILSTVVLLGTLVYFVLQYRRRINKFIRILFKNSI